MISRNFSSGDFEQSDESKGLLSLTAVGFAAGIAGCTDLSDITTFGNGDRPVDAVEGYWEAVESDDTDAIDERYWGDVTASRIDEEAAIGVAQLGVGYNEVTSVDIETIESGSLENFPRFSYRDGRWTPRNGSRALERRPADV